MPGSRVEWGNSLLQVSRPSDRRVVALDLGEVRTGVAISDAGGMIARPLAVVPGGEVEGYLERVIREEEVREVVVGVPRTLSGEIGFQARHVLEELEMLKNRFPEVRFVEWDERLTTRLAVADTGRKKKGRKPVDDIAAARMLQEYLRTRGDV